MFLHTMRILGDILSESRLCSRTTKWGGIFGGGNNQVFSRDKHRWSQTALVQTLILGELTKIDTDYIGTICGSYRRGKTVPVVFSLDYAVESLRRMTPPPPHLKFAGAASSGDIDILLTHPDFTSQTEKQVSLLAKCNAVCRPVVQRNLSFKTDCSAKAPPRCGGTFGVDWLCDRHSF